MGRKCIEEWRQRHYRIKEGNIVELGRIGSEDKSRKMNTEIRRKRNEKKNSESAN